MENPPVAIITGGFLIHLQFILILQTYCLSCQEELWNNLKSYSIRHFFLIPIRPQ
jgi:hypothetical protein